jgi:hypothetical protein
MARGHRLQIRHQGSGARLRLGMERVGLQELRELVDARLRFVRRGTLGRSVLGRQQRQRAGARQRREE